MHRLTRAAFFSSTHLCTHTKEHLVHACLHKMYPQVFLEQEVLRVLAELNAVEIACIVYARITTCKFYSSSNRAVTYIGILTQFFYKYFICWNIGTKIEIVVLFKGAMHLFTS